MCFVLDIEIRVKIKTLYAIGLALNLRVVSFNYNYPNNVRMIGILKIYNFTKNQTWENMEPFHIIYSNISITIGTYYIVS